MSSDDPKEANQAPGAEEPTALGAEPFEVKAEAPSAAPGAPSLAQSQPPLSRKLAPPPKPSRDSRPSVPPPAGEPRPMSSMVAMRSPMIVVGGSSPSPPRPSAPAQAWTRPPSERPPSNPPRAPSAPRRDVPPASVEALRAKLDFGRERPTGPGLKSAPAPVPPRPASKPDDETSRPEPPTPRRLENAAAQARSLAEAVAVEATEPAAATSQRASKPDVEAAASQRTSKPDVEAAAVKPAEPAPVAMTEAAPAKTSDRPVATATAAAADSAAKPSSQPPADAPDASGERRRSSPARLRVGPPRPRMSSSAGARPLSNSSRPASRSGEIEVAVDQSPEMPPPPKMPEFVPAVTAPVTMDESTEAGQRKSEPPVPAPAIAVMRIVAVGDGELQIPTELEGDVDGIDVDVEPVDEASAARGDEGEALSGVEGGGDDLEELPVEDLAPDSGERATPVPDDLRDDAISIPPTEIVAEGDLTPPPTGRELEPRPPPPPKRGPRTPSLPKPVPQAKRRQKRPWWEDVFGDDFVRANFRTSDGQIHREVDFIEESLGVAAGGVVLDLGCGPGHHAVELASRGYGVVGYDLSLYQLALASDVAQERGQKLNFLQGDMREMAFDEMFDGIFSWNTSFGYFEEEKNAEVAERVFRALRPGGMFLIDVVNRDFVSTQSPCQLWYEGDSCVCMDDMSLDFITSRMRVKRSVILDDGRTRECVYSIRVYSLHELGKLLHDVGFRVTEASGHPSTPGVFFGESSPRIIVLAQKP